VRRDAAPQETIKELHTRTLVAVNDAYRLERQLPELEARCERMTRQRIADSERLEKGEAMRSKLQDLCRELQKQNKEVRAGLDGTGRRLSC